MVIVNLKMKPEKQEQTGIQIEPLRWLLPKTKAFISHRKFFITTKLCKLLIN